MGGTSRSDPKRVRVGSNTLWAVIAACLAATLISSCAAPPEVTIMPEPTAVEVRATATPTQTETPTPPDIPTPTPVPLSPDVQSHLTDMLTELTEARVREQIEYGLVNEGGAWIVRERILGRTIRESVQDEAGEWVLRERVREAREIIIGAVRGENLAIQVEGEQREVPVQSISMEEDCDLVVVNEAGEVSLLFSEWSADWIESVWQASQDGRIVYNEAQLAEGLFTINEEATEHIWEEMIRNLYMINQAGENRTFLNQFPTLEAFRRYAQSGRPVINMWIPIEHPGSGIQFTGMAIWIPIEPVVLSRFALAFEYTTYEQEVRAPAETRPFIFYTLGEVLLERVTVDGEHLIGYTFRQPNISDATWDPPMDIMGFSRDNTPERNLQSATLAANLWFLKTDTFVDQPGVGVINLEWEQPTFNLGIAWGMAWTSEEISTDFAHSPFRLR